MNFKVFSVLALMALVFVFTTTADPVAEEHVSEMVQNTKHASEDHHAAAGKANAAHSHHVKKVKDGKKHEPSRDSREAKAAQQHKKETPAVPIKASNGKKPYKFLPKAA
ncbi:uncharacterized protein LOC124207807 [Daphnia pulex]|uniref:uncharacterized protein LOC124207807 n=1 Tax=Daphnia pulex TaxID=6669 RepID=UPI001EDCE5F9|nr:uncharacterized protein LOC124207807 [Daphnia pulex]